MMIDLPFLGLIFLLNTKHIMCLSLSDFQVLYHLFHSNSLPPHWFLYDFTHSRSLSLTVRVAYSQCNLCLQSLFWLELADRHQSTLHRLQAKCLSLPNPELVHLLSSCPLFGLLCHCRCTCSISRYFL